MSGIAVTIPVPGASGSGTQTIKCSSPTNIAGISVTNGLFTATTAAEGTGDQDAGGATVAFSTSTVLYIRDI